jgi:hypothetical protein
VKLDRALGTLLGELTDGAAEEACWVLNPEDPGLLRSLDRLSAAAASNAPHNGGPPIAAHVDHLRYGFSLLNRWSQGDDPFADANYAASWEVTNVSDAEWARLRTALRTELHRFLDTIRNPRTLTETELTGVIAGVVHLAYHLGAIRQIDRSIGGPASRD